MMRTLLSVVSDFTTILLPLDLRELGVFAVGWVGLEGSNLFEKNLGCSSSGPVLICFLSFFF